MEVTLERQEGAAFKPVDPGFVFDKGDRVRFRFRANFDGYLYVMNYGTSGNYSLLFPREETGRENSIESGKEYRIPATEAWFRIAGPPGHDIVYWLVSPLRWRPAVTACLRCRSRSSRRRSCCPAATIPFSVLAACASIRARACAAFPRPRNFPRI